MESNQLYHDLPLMEAVLRILDRSGQLTDIESKCQKLRKAKNTLVYKFFVLVNPADVTDENAHLGNKVLCTPTAAESIFQTVVYQYIQSHQLLYRGLSLSQVSVSLRLTSLPALDDLTTIGCIKDISRNSPYNGFYQLAGVVSGISGTSKYTQSTRYVCPDKECPGSTGNKYIRVHVAGALESHTIRQDFQCALCGLTLEEDVSSRTLSDKVTVHVLPEKDFKSVGSRIQGSRIQAVKVVLRDDLTTPVKMGETCCIVGRIRKDREGEVITVAFEANNVLQGPNSGGMLRRELPDSIAKLFEDNKHSPWSFVQTLALSFAGELFYPKGLFFQLKLGILLSLAAADEGLRVHVLAVGRETGLAGRLLQFGTAFARKSLHHSSSNDLRGKVKKDAASDAPYFVEGGSLLLASGGVCMLGDISDWKKPLKEQLQSVVSSGKVHLDLGAKLTGGLASQLVYPLGCQVWALARPLPKPRSNPLPSSCNPEDTFRPILDAFGIAYLTEGSEQDDEDILAVYTAWHLRKAMGVPDGSAPEISEADFQSYFSFIQGLHPAWLPQAELLLQQYFAAARRTRQSFTGGSSVPVTALQTLVNLASAHAKLSVRPDVTEDDALMAIKLYEESLTSRFGFSELGIKPFPHLSNPEADLWMKTQLDAYMAQFKVRLHRYCQTYAAIHEEE